MSHYPVNHPLRPFYRGLAAISGLYVLVFGLVGTARAIGAPMFDRSDLVVLGLRTNLAFALMSIGAGVVILLAWWVGRNVDRVVNLWGGVGFMTVGTALLALLHTELNVLNFSMATVIVSFSIGMLLFTAGMYGLSRPASPRSASGERSEPARDAGLNVASPRSASGERSEPARDAGLNVASPRSASGERSEPARDAGLNVASSKAQKAS